MGTGGRRLEMGPGRPDLILAGRPQAELFPCRPQAGRRPGFSGLTGRKICCLSVSDACFTANKYFCPKEQVIISTMANRSASAATVLNNH